MCDHKWMCKIFANRNTRGKVNFNNIYRITLSIALNSMPAAKPILEYYLNILSIRDEFQVQVVVIAIFLSV